MKFLYLVDLHGNRHSLKNFGEIAEEEAVKAVIVGGDITNFGTISEAIEILRELRETTGREIFFIPGNCDDKKLLDWEGEEKIINIHLRKQKIGEITILGLGGSLTTPFYTYIEFSEEEIKELLNKFEKDEIHIFVTHSPPSDTKLDIVYGGKHVGSKAIREFITNVKPSIVLTGHIHESSGMDKLMETTLVNPGPASRGNYAVFSIEKNEVEVALENV
ncbi:MAG: metallophosphoesterase family protein [Candidatus Njordarchaeia archaeon]